VVQAGDLVRAWLDGVSGLFEELADVADAPVDCSGVDAEQGGDGGLRQGEALVEDGGQEPVGEGADGAAASSAGRSPGSRLAARLRPPPGRRARPSGSAPESRR
jgi:hypothetical protein